MGLQILPGATDCQRLHHMRANEIIDGPHAFADRDGVGIAFESVVFFDERGEETLEVGGFERGVFAVLKEVNKVGDVAGAVIERRRGNEDHLLGVGMAEFVATPGWRFADALKLLIHPGGVGSELMSLVHHDEIIVLGMADLVQTAGGDDPGILEIDLSDGVSPVSHEGGRHDEERRGVMIGDVAVGVVKALGNERGDEGFAKADDVGEEEAAVAMQFSVTIAHGIRLIREFFEARRQILQDAGVVVNGGTKILGEEFDEEVVRGERIVEEGLPFDFLHVLGADSHAFIP
jgi:hypothetical protein